MTVETRQSIILHDIRLGQHYWSDFGSNENAIGINVGITNKLHKILKNEFTNSKDKLCVVRVSMINCPIQKYFIIGQVMTKINFKSLVYLRNIWTKGLFSYFFGKVRATSVKYFFSNTKSGI